MLSTCRWILAAFSCIALAMGCSDDDDGGGNANTAGTGAAAGSGGTGGGNVAGAAGASGMDSAAKLTLESPDFEDGAMLPAKHRCVMLNGETGPSPALTWSGGPAEVMSYAVMLTDKTFMNYAHWTIYDIPVTVSELPENVPPGAMPAEPAGSTQGPNSPALTSPGYFGPCASSGVNTYEFTVHALDVATLPDLSSTSTVAEVRQAIMDHTLETGTLTVMSGP